MLLVLPIHSSARTQKLTKKSSSQIKCRKDRKKKFWHSLAFIFSVLLLCWLRFGEILEGFDEENWGLLAYPSFVPSPCLDIYLKKHVKVLSLYISAYTSCFYDGLLWTGTCSSGDFRGTEYKPNICQTRNSEFLSYTYFGVSVRQAVT
jgi:hypothetical protein